MSDAVRDGRPGTPDWLTCPHCRALLYGKRLARNLYVCPRCGHHLRLPARARIAQLLDAGSFVEVDAGPVDRDPLGFCDDVPYPRRLIEASRRSGEQEAAVVGTGSIGGLPVVLAVLNFPFLGGSMGAAVGESVTAAAELAHDTRTPLLLVTSSGGARMQEGCLSLMQMAKTAQAIAALREDGILCVCVLTDPTFGGVTASFAMLGHVIVAEQGALVGFAGPRVIRETIRQELPADFQSAEFLLRHGMADRVEHRAGLRPLLERLLRLHRPPSRISACRDGRAVIRSAAALAPVDDPWTVVRQARRLDRPTTLDYLQLVFDDFCELHGDRCFGDDPAIVGGPARLGDRTVMVIGHQKGHNTRELVARNFGMAHPEGYRKVIRLMNHAASLHLPVVTLIDTPGAYPGVDAEQRGQAAAVAECIMRSARLPVPVVPVITGEGGSGGALALGTGDRVLMLENAFYSVISPEGCAAILWRSRESAPAAARALRLSAGDLLRLGVVHAVVPEPAGGAHADPRATAENLRRAVLDMLDELADVPAETLVKARHARFRAYGTGTAQPGGDGMEVPAA
jgi:acetyl-CoA carboxylase carboxyl transferase alpha subunit/acetyl-CoA carboxylase carboxyl transferase beta subunit